MIVESSNTIAFGEWAEGGTWQIVPFDELPQELAERPDLCTAVGVVALHDLAGSDDLPKVVMTLQNKGRKGKRSEWETASGKVDPLNPDEPDGAREDLEYTGRRESMEELGVRLGRLVPFAARISKNPPDSPWPGLSYMKYYAGFTVGQIGTPTEIGHISQAMTLEKVGDLARTPPEVAEAGGIHRASLVDIKLVRAALVALAYPKEQVYDAIGPLE